jgi:hypothetical protein
LTDSLGPKTLVEHFSAQLIQFLWTALHWAAHVDEQPGITATDLKHDPSMSGYVDDWGHEGDLGLVALIETNCVAQFGCDGLCPPKNEPCRGSLVTRHPKPHLRSCPNIKPSPAAALGSQLFSRFRTSPFFETASNRLATMNTHAAAPSQRSIPTPDLSTSYQSGLVGISRAKHPRHTVRCACAKFVSYDCAKMLIDGRSTLSARQFSNLGGTMQARRLEVRLLRLVAVVAATPFRLVGIVLSGFGLASGSPWAAVLSSSRRRRSRRR